MTGVTEREISRGDWGEFCERWGRAHRGWLVDVRVRTNGSAETVAVSRPLRAIRSSAPGSVALLVDGERPRALELEGVERVIEEQEDGAHRGLRLEGPRTTIHMTFRAPARPETVDGLAKAERLDAELS